MRRIVEFVAGVKLRPPTAVDVFSTAVGGTAVRAGRAEGEIQLAPESNISWKCVRSRIDGFLSSCCYEPGTGLTGVAASSEAIALAVASRAMASPAVSDFDPSGIAWPPTASVTPFIARPAKMAS